MLVNGPCHLARKTERAGSRIIEFGSGLRSDQDLAIRQQSGWGSNQARSFKPRITSLISIISRNGERCSNGVVELGSDNNSAAIPSVRAPFSPTSDQHLPV